MNPFAPEPAHVVAAIASVAGPVAMLHEPLFRGREWEYVKECIDTGWVSTAGKFVERFETMLVEYTGISHASAVVNGTAALHVCLILAGIGQNDEVICQPLTFAATCAAIAYCGGVPHFVDVSPRTLGLCSDALETRLNETAEIVDGVCRNRLTGRRIGAVVCMHTYGHAVELDRLAALCARWHLPLIEDAAESLGSFYQGRHTGHWGVLSAVSFNGNKIVTTGGGGAVLTNDPYLARQAKHLTTTAKLPHRWEFEHDRVGYNYRLPNLNAALGCAQLEQLPNYVAAKRTLAQRYAEAFRGVANVSFFTEPSGCCSNYWLNVILLDHPDRSARDAILTATNDAGLMTRPAWQLMHRLAPYALAPHGDLRVAESLYDRLINIPSSVTLGESHG